MSTLNGKLDIRKCDNPVLCHDVVFTIPHNKAELPRREKSLGPLCNEAFWSNCQCDRNPDLINRTKTLHEAWAGCKDATTARATLLYVVIA